MGYLFTSESIISFFVLVILEIVLGIDNVIFVSIIINRLPPEKEKAARRLWMVTHPKRQTRIYTLQQRF
jgi:predicted tellurium resistance membrane protein TerC